jgi:hypothetical protein
MFGGYINRIEQTLDGKGQTNHVGDCPPLLMLSRVTRDTNMLTVISRQVQIAANIFWMEVILGNSRSCLFVLT